MTSPEPAPEFNLEDFLPYRLSVVTNRVSRAFASRYEAAWGLAIPEWRVLAVVGSFAPLSAAEVCDRTAMDKVKVSRAVARLVRRGLLERRRDGSDQRVQLLSLGPKGREVYEGVVPMARAIEGALTAALSPGERKNLLRALDKLDSCVAELEDRATSPWD
jgi:DNA-binding MarR family transcriptional regulator